MPDRARWRKSAGGPLPPHIFVSFSIRCQMDLNGEECGRAPLRNTSPFDREASLDLAEELFVACRFTEAASVCNDALSSDPPPSSGNDDSTGGNGLAGSVSVVAFEDQTIAPLRDCTTSDLIVAVLLQCGFELRRTEEWRRCRAFYCTRGAMPFGVAILWLRLRLAGGEFDLVREVLWQLRTALGEELLNCSSTIGTENDEGQGHGKRIARFKAAANYTEATEMLVVQIMLPCGESDEAWALVSKDACLGVDAKSRLFKACELSAIRTAQEKREYGNTAAGGETTARSAATGNGSLHAQRGDVRRAGSGRSDSDGLVTSDNTGPAREESTARHEQQQQGLVQKLVSDVCHWTPEARLQLVVGAGTAGLVAYAALRNRGSLLRIARRAASVMARTAGDIGSFIVGSS